MDYYQMLPIYLRPVTTVWRDQLYVYDQIFCELPRVRDSYMQTLTPQEQWFAVLRNIRNFAEKPEWLDARFDPLMDLARTGRLTQEEITKYLQSMVSEREKRDIGNAYYRRGMAEGMERGMEKKALEMARAMLADGKDFKEITKYTGLTEEDIKDGIDKSRS